MVVEERKVAFLTDSVSGWPSRGRSRRGIARGSPECPKVPSVHLTWRAPVWQRGIHFEGFAELQGFIKEKSMLPALQSPFGNPLTVWLWFLSF